MSSRKIEELDLMPKLSTSEKRVYATLSTNGASTLEELSNHSGISKGRLPNTLKKLSDYGFITSVDREEEGSIRYVATYPIKRFITVISVLINALEARKSELEATTRLVNNFTETAIKNVRQASTEERSKRKERSEKDIKDLEIAIDASLSGILASVEMDLQDLSKIAKTSNEFLTESSIRTKETCTNLKKKIETIAEEFSTSLQKAKTNGENYLESIVDARVSDVLDFETNASQAFDEVLDAFKDSQDAFEEIIFSVLDAGIADLERVTRPINEQIETAINSLKAAIKQSSNNFQTEILRVLTEQKRPMITTIENIRPLTMRDLDDAYKTQITLLEKQNQTLAELMKNHATLFNNAAEHLAEDFNAKLNTLIEQSLESTSKIGKELDGLQERFKNEAEESMVEKESRLQKTSLEVRDLLTDFLQQFTDLLNRSLASYKMDLSDLIAEIGSEILNMIETGGTSTQNIINYLNIVLAEPVKTFSLEQEKLAEKMGKEEELFFTKIEKALQKKFAEIKEEYLKETDKQKEEFKQESTRVQEKVFNGIKDERERINERFSKNQRAFQKEFRKLSKKIQDETRETNKELSIIAKNLDNWQADNLREIDNNISSMVKDLLADLSGKIDDLVEDIDKKDNSTTKEQLVDLITNSFTTLTNEYEKFNNIVLKTVKQDFKETSKDLKDESLKINNKFVELKQNQDKYLTDIQNASLQVREQLTADYKNFYEKVEPLVKRFSSEQIETFADSTDEIKKMIANTLDKEVITTSKEMNNIREGFEKARTENLSKTKKNIEDFEQTIIKESTNLSEQESSARANITELTEEVINKLSDTVNETADTLETNLGEGAETVFNQAIAEINKQEFELKELNERQLKEMISHFEKSDELVLEQLEYLGKKIDTLRDNQIGSASKFRENFYKQIESDIQKHRELLNQSEEEIMNSSKKLNQDISFIIDKYISEAIQNLEVQTSGIEGAIFNTVGNITSEAAQRTERVAVIGEQAVLGIEDRYTENLERIRQNLTDEVINRIEEEAKKIAIYKARLKEIGRNHLKIYGTAISDLNDAIQGDLNKAEKTSLRTIDACGSISCRFLEELNTEIGAMGARVGTSVDQLTDEILQGFERVLQKVKRDAGQFARRQFDLSNRSNQEIAEAFLKSVDDLEEVMLKQIESFGTRTKMAIERTKELSNEINEYIVNISETFTDLQD
jgi:sugar-specific transcriptional regulator TrmB